MLAEFLQKIADLVTKAQHVDIFTIPGNPQELLVRHGEELLREQVPPPARAHQLAGFADLVEALKDKAIAPAPEVYVSAACVKALLDRENRRQTVAIQLAPSRRFQLCAGLENQPRGFSPKDAVKFLRMEMHGTSVDAVAQALARIDFKRTVGGVSDVAHGKESLGRSVEAAVQQADQVPQQFHAYIPVWTTKGFEDYSQAIDFGLHLDMEAGAIELRVLSDEIEKARNAALATVAKDLRDALPGVPVFMGTP
jgi:hypothetical protein